MEFRKILPAAAGIIALTSSIAFAGDFRPVQESENLRVRVTENEPGGDATDNFASSAERTAGQVFHVSIEHGDNAKVVLVDARTGKVIGGV